MNLRRVAMFTLAIFFGLMIGRSDAQQRFSELFEVNPQVREQRFFYIGQDIKALNDSMGEWNDELSRSKRVEDIDPDKLLAHVRKAQEALARIEYSLANFDVLEARHVDNASPEARDDPLRRLQDSRGSP
jgi:hypothetical protein